MARNTSHRGMTSRTLYTTYRERASSLRVCSVCLICPSHLLEPAIFSRNTNLSTGAHHGIENH